ncbi:hypothetical protein [Azospirillum cavernae]|nr:hypothetical protein [Azospirillum cavernae]
MSDRRGSGRPPLDRIPGSLMPVYKLLQELMPHIQASRSQSDLAFALGKRLNKPTLSVPNMLRELSGTAEQPDSIHPKYLRAFKELYELEAQGITDDVLLHPDATAREAIIRALMGQRCFDWLWAQRTDEPRLAFADPPAKAPAARLGPNGNRFQRLPLTVADNVPAGAEFRFAIDMPWPGYATILSQDPTEQKVELMMAPGRSTIQRPTFSLDAFAGVPDGPLPQGRSVLPGRLTMDPPLGLTRTILLAARQPFACPWTRQPPSELTPEQLAAFMRSLIHTPIIVSCLEYHVVDSSAQAPDEY